MTATHALGWALVHSLWQCALAAVALALLLAIVPARSARIRYALATATLVLTLALPLTTAVRVGEASPATPGNGLATSAVASRPASDATPAAQAASPEGAMVAQETPRGYAPTTPAIAALRLASRSRTALEPVLPWIVALWLAGVLVLSARLAWGWIATRRLGAMGTRPAPVACVEALERLAARLRVSRPVRVLESAVLQVPAVLGLVRPVILVPASALTGLTPLQLDALLAHELAHVRRYDYLVNLIQSVIETLLFYHPAVWWISWRVRQEREHCCDDLAVAACGDAHFYAAALLGMERLRVAAPTLALTAAGGSLMDRVRRLVAPAPTEIFPRWAAGVIAVTLVAAIGGGSRLADRASSFVAPDGARTAPDTVLRHPDPARPLSERWDWARRQAQQLGGRSFWVGYSVHPPTGSARGGAADRAGDLQAESRGGGEGGLRGDRLARLVGDRAGDDDIALLFDFRESGGRPPVLRRAQPTSFLLPVDFAGAPLLWLGPADDRASLAQLQALFAAAPTTDLKEDLIAGVGLHGSSDAVVPILGRWLAGDARASVRAEAAEWLGHRPTPAAVRELARAARADPDEDVREEAAEALRHNALPAATDSLIALARAVDDPETRREAVEELDHKGDPRATAALIAIARDDRDADVQHEAVEALGAIRDGSGVRAVIDFARSHPNPDVRSRAVETLAEAAAPGVALAVLKDVAYHDRDRHVQRRAVEELKRVDDERAIAALVEIARHHPVRDVRREALKRLGDLETTDSATAALLEETASEGSDADLQRDAVAALGHLPGAQALAGLARLARTHRSAEVRREAIERYAKGAAPESARVLLTERLANDRSPSVQAEAIEGLTELPNQLGLAAVSEAARAHPNRDVRAEARRRLGERP